MSGSPNRILITYKQPWNLRLTAGGVKTFPPGNYLAVEEEPYGQGNSYDLFEADSNGQQKEPQLATVFIDIEGEIAITI